MGIPNRKKSISDRHRAKHKIPSKKDAIASIQHQTIIDLLGSGEIEGFPSATGSKGSDEYNESSLKDVFLDGSQVLKQSAGTNPDETDFNFKNVTFEPRFGTSNQDPIDFISETERENSVGVKVTKDNPVSRDITDTNVNAVRVTLVFPSLQEFEDDGDINGAAVKLNIQTIENDGTTKTVISDTVKGRSASSYFIDYKIKLKSSTSFPVTIRVNRVTSDSTSSKKANDFLWSSFTEIFTEQKSYPDMAHVGIRFDAETFSNIPRRSYRVRGTKIKIPHNSTVRSDGSLSYSGTFNGTFKANKEWTSDPAWILYDLLTSSKGLGDHIAESDLDVFSFFSASQYASEQVDDGSGTGSTEPRFSFNAVLNTRKQAYRVINDLCSVMRAMPFYSAGNVEISCDKPTDASYLFNLSNVTEEGFVYGSTSKGTKFSVVNVAYFDNETQTIDYETVEDTSLQTKYGQNITNITAFATNSRGQASRLGKWFLYTQSNEAQTVTFTTTLEAGVIVRCGAVISIQDPMKAGVRRGGRIKTGVSTTEIIVDDSNNTDLVTTDSATLSVILTDGSLETKSISSISGSTITVSSAFSSVPQSNSVWVIENTSLQLQLFRVISVAEASEFNYTIKGIAYDPNKYSFVEDGTALPTRTITTLTEIKPSPSSLQGTEQIVVLNNRAVSKLFITWQPVNGVTEYFVRYRFKNENFITETVSRPDFTIFETLNGTYDIEVFSINALGEPSENAAETQFTTVGKTALPDDVQNVQIEPLSDQFVRLRFDQSTSVDVVHGGNVVIRSSNLTTGATFTNAVDVVPELAGNISEAIVPNIGTGTYLLVFKDDGDRLSENAASIVNISTEPDVLPKLSILVEREDLDSPPFQGVRDDCFFSDEVNGLVLGSTDLIDDVTDFDAIADFDFLGNVDFLTGGQYFFKNTLDLGGKQPLKLRRHFVTQGFTPNDLIDKRTANIDTWTDFDAATSTNVNATLSVAITDSDPDLSVAAAYTINDGAGGSGTTITITKTSHGYSVGSLVTLDFTSGTGVDGDYIIQSVPNANTYTLTSATSLNTSGNCTYSAEFEQYQKFVNGTYIARGFKFKCDLLSNDPAQSIEIDQLGYVAEIASRTETSLGNAAASSGGFIASGTSTKSIVFSDNFFTGQGGTSVGVNSVLPSIGITIENQSQGDFFTLSNITGTGFDIDIKDLNGNHVNRNFKYAATGFGRGS